MGFGSNTGANSKSYVDASQGGDVTDLGVMNYQTAMSNTAHQREVQDLQASGLNPILSANNGASTESGSNAQTTAKQQMKMQKELTKMELDNAKEVANINANAQKYSADKSYKAQIYGSDSTYKGTTESAKIYTEANKWITRHTNETSISITKLQTKAQKYTSMMNYKSAIATAGATIKAAQLGYDATVYTVDNQNMGYSLKIGDFSVQFTVSRNEYQTAIDNMTELTNDLSSQFGSAKELRKKKNQEKVQALFKKYGWNYNTKTGKATYTGKK